MALTQKQTEGWIRRRRERKRLKLERTGSPQKESEPARKPEEPDVEETAQKASTVLLANGGWFEG